MENRLRLLRAERGGLSQSALARALRQKHGDGWYLDRIHKIEREYVEPTSEQAQQLADYFGVTIRRVFPRWRRVRRKLAARAAGDRS
jgi:DNA-binding XRE family transcriptional regulator